MQHKQQIEFFVLNDHNLLEIISCLEEKTQMHMHTLKHGLMGQKRIKKNLQQATAKKMCFKSINHTHNYTVTVINHN